MHKSQAEQAKRDEPYHIGASDTGVLMDKTRIVPASIVSSPRTVYTSYEQKC